MDPRFEPRKLDVTHMGVGPQAKIPIKKGTISPSENPDVIKTHHFHTNPVGLSPWINKPFRPNPPSLNENQKKEIQEIVKKNVKRPGVLGFTYGIDTEKNTTSFGVRVDPTARGDWVLSKEETLYELPIIYETSLYEYVKSIRKSLES